MKTRPRPRTMGAAALVTTIITFVGAATLGLFPCQAAAQADVRIYDVHITKNLMVPMRDGVRLATDIYRPARNGEPIEGRWPVVLHRIPYNKDVTKDDRSTQGDPWFFARHGYVFVAQDARGRYESEGEYRPFSRHDLGRDGYDAVVWAANQDWSNGKVATIGVSYGGLTQITLGAEDPPGLSAQFPREIFDNAYRSGFYQGGAMRLRRIPWVLRMASTSREARADPKIAQALASLQETRTWIEGFPLAYRWGTSPLAVLPHFEAFLVGGIEHNTYGPYWKDFSLSLPEDWENYADVPVLNVGSWYDIHSVPTPDLYNNLKRRKNSHQRLVMGPWMHARELQSFAGDVEFGPEAAVDINVMGLRWFDQFLRGVDAGILDEPPIRIFVMGGGDGHRTPEGRIFHGGEWRFEEEWPLARTRYTPFYLHEDGTLRRLSPEGPSSSATVYTHDPRNPVPTVGGVDPFQPWTDGGGFDQRDRDGVPLRFRPDVLVFQTAPLQRDVEVTGPITVKLYASSSLVNTDFTVKLVHVYPRSPDWPEGFELNLSDGILRASHRESTATLSPIEPGRIYELTIEIPHVSNLFKRGDRIRVDVSSSNFPRFDVNPGTMDPPLERRSYDIAENRIYHDQEHPSHILLPIIPQ